jgi:hypothetical protein
MAFKLSLSLPLRRAQSMDAVAAEDACATEAAEPLSPPVTPALRRSSLDASLGMLRRISAPALLLAGAPPADATSLLPPQLLDSDQQAYNGLWKKDWAASEDMVRPDWWGLRFGRRTFPHHASHASLGSPSPLRAGAACGSHGSALDNT